LIAFSAQVTLGISKVLQSRFEKQKTILSPLKRACSFHDQAQKKQKKNKRKPKTDRKVFLVCDDRYGTQSPLVITRNAWRRSLALM